MDQVSDKVASAVPASVLSSHLEPNKAKRNDGVSIAEWLDAVVARADELLFRRLDPYVSHASSDVPEVMCFRTKKSLSDSPVEIMLPLYVSRQP